GTCRWGRPRPPRRPSAHRPRRDTFRPRRPPRAIRRQRRAGDRTCRTRTIPPGWRCARRAASFPSGGHRATIAPMLRTIEWTSSAARLLDQTKLPTETVYVDVTDERQMWDAIKRLVVRGAPAIGIAAAFGAYLGVKDFDTDELAEFDRKL